MNRSMVLMASFLVFASSAMADIKVLFRFDASGHSAHRVVRDVDSRPSLFQVENDTHLVTLTWYDISGTEISTMLAPDPRVLRTPAHIDGAVDSTVTQDSGAWMATGPDDAMAVAILLPRRDSLALGAEQWHIMLD